MALNEKAWDALCTGAVPGDTVTLQLVSMAGSSYSRDLILSGVFRDEAYTAVSDWDSLSLLSDSLGCIPDILVCRDAPEFQDDKQEREYVFTLAPHSSIEALFTRLPYSNLVGIDFLGTPFRPGAMSKSSGQHNGSPRVKGAVSRRLTEGSAKRSHSSWPDPRGRLGTPHPSRLRRATFPVGEGSLRRGDCESGLRAVEFLTVIGETP